MLLRTGLFIYLFYLSGGFKLVSMCKCRLALAWCRFTSSKIIWCTISAGGANLQIYISKING